MQFRRMAAACLDDMRGLSALGRGERADLDRLLDDLSPVGLPSELTEGLNNGVGGMASLGEVDIHVPDAPIPRRASHQSLAASGCGARSRAAMPSALRWSVTST